MNISINEKIKIIFEIMIAIEYLHSRNLIYRDLKPNNVIIDSNGTVVLIDFDRMIENKENNNDDNATKDFGSIYIAPEIINGENYSLSADIYSIGIMIYFILYEKSPNQNDVCDANFPQQLLNFKDIFVKCTKRNPKDRPNISQLINDFYNACFSKIHKELAEINPIQSIKSKDINKYFKYMVFVSEFKHFYSLYKLGKFYWKGKYIGKDLNKVIQYFTLSAEKNYIKSL